MYEYRPELKGKGKFPTQFVYQGKTKAEAIEEMAAKESIEQEQQNSKEVPPKDIAEIPTSQAFEKGSNSESTTQKEEPMVLNEGYIKAYRKTIKSRVFKNEGLFKIWMWCLFKASHTEQWVTIKTGRGSTEVHLLPGQFVFGRKKAAKELNMKEPTVQKRIKKLENMGNCISQSIRHCSVVTVANWEFYQGSKKKVSGKVSTKYQPSITYKNVKNEKKDIYSQNFLSFWNNYPHKVAKQIAYKAWQKLEKAEDMEALLPTLLDAIEKQEQAKERAKGNGEFVPEWPHGATWLNGRRWEDEVDVKKQWDHAR